MNTLTPRERQVIELLCKGRENKEVARELKISVRTVEDHRTNILHKLQLRNLVQVVRWFYKIEDAA